jgi:hypothetical protein
LHIIYIGSLILIRLWNSALHSSISTSWTTLIILTFEIHALIVTHWSDSMFEIFVFLIREPCLGITTFPKSALSNHKKRVLTLFFNHHTIIFWFWIIIYRLVKHAFRLYLSFHFLNRMFYGQKIRLLSVWRTLIFLSIPRKILVKWLISNPIFFFLRSFTQLVFL